LREYWNLSAIIEEFDEAIEGFSDSGALIDDLSAGRELFF